MVPNWAYRLATFCTRPSVTLLLMDSLSVSYAVATARPASPLPCWEIQESLPFFTAAKDATATLCLPSVCMGDGPPRVDGRQPEWLSLKGIHVLRFVRKIKTALQNGCTKICSQQAGGGYTQVTRCWNDQNGSPFPIRQVTQMETHFYFAFPWL